MNKIHSLSRDEMTGARVGRCGDWYIRARHGGGSFDVTQPPFKRWDEVPSEFTGLSLDQTARLLGVPQGELYNWARDAP